MAYSGGIISKPVRTIDIAQALGASSRDVGTLCQHANINKWAKNKPFRLDKLSAVTAQERQNANYGLNFVVTEGEVGNDVIGAVKRAAQDTTCYSYNTTATGYLAQGKPRGRAYNEWFRMLDFNGYRHDAPAPIQGFQDTTINLYNHPISVNLYIYSTLDPPTEGISLADVIAGVKARMGIDLTNWYIILAWRYGSTGGYYTVSQENIGQTSRDFNFSIQKNQMPIGSPNFYLAAVSDKTPNYYSRIAGLPFLRADIAGYGWGTFNVVSEIPFQFDWQRVWTSMNGSTRPSIPWNNMPDIYHATYYQWHEGSGTPDVHLQIRGNDGNIVYGFKVTNTSNYAARLYLREITIQGHTAAVAGWYNEGPEKPVTGYISANTGYYASSPTGTWSDMPEESTAGRYVDISARGTVYIAVVFYEFFKNYEDYPYIRQAELVTGKSTRGALTNLKYAGLDRQIIHEEAYSWERNAVINIEV